MVPYNTTVRHHGEVFHIETELLAGAVLTTLLHNGGRIVWTMTQPAWLREVTVKELMQSQHKAMFTALRDGHVAALSRQGEA